MFGLKKTLTLFAPITGKIVDIVDVPDEMFSQKMMGDGVAIQPSEGVVLSPFDGVITTIFHTKHAIGLTADNGVEILIHVGLDTVALNGDGFESFIKEGQKVKAGDKLLTFDISKIESAGYKTVTPIIVLNPNLYKNIEIIAPVNVTMGKDDIIKITK